MNLNKNDVLKYLKWLLILAAIICCGILMFRNNKLRNIQEDLNSKNKVTQTYYDEKIKSLKKKNKALYDSIKNLKDVESAVQFKYIKDYDIDTVYIKQKENSNMKDNRPIVTYKYKNSLKNDTLNYELSIGSKEEPNWYKLHVNVGDKFTIINRRNGDLNQTTVSTETHDTQIVDVTPIHVKKNTFWQRFNVNANISAGYGLFNKKPDVYVGIGVGFNLFKK